MLLVPQGAGTPNFPISTYLKKMGLKYFDIVISASADRLTETDKLFFEVLKDHGQQQAAQQMLLLLDEVREASWLATGGWLHLCNSFL